MPFELDVADSARDVIEAMRRDPSQAARFRKVSRTLARLQLDPRHPGLNSHRYETKHGPNGEPIWESYIENRTPGAWRIWWWYGPGQGVISILAIGPHPD